MERAKLIPRNQTGNSDPRQVAVVGVGNVLLSDEGVGIHAIRALRKIGLPTNVVLFELHTRGLEILDMAKGMTKMVIIDAVKSGSPPGSIRKWRLGEMVDTKSPSLVSLHEINLLTTLKIGKATEMLPEDVIIVGIEPKDLSPKLELSRELKAKFQELLDIVLKEARIQTTSEQVE